MDATSINEIVQSKRYSHDELLRSVVVFRKLAKDTSNFLDFLCRAIPLQNYQLSHLKRVRKNKDDSQMLDIIICPTESFNDIKACGKELIDAEEKQEHILVVRYPPETREEFKEWSKYWPMNYYPNQLDKLRERGFSKEELDNINNWMKVTDEDKSKINNRCIKIEDGDKLFNTLHAGGIIVNRNNDRLVMTSYESLLTLENILNFQIHDGNSSSNQPPTDIVETDSNFKRILSNPIYSSTMLCIEGTAAIVRGAIDGQGSLPDNFYLCTDLDMYLTHEPDMMSAMALVHSRIGRIFYRFPDPIHGAIESNHIHIHSLKALNHHYRAFRIESVEAPPK